MENETKQCKYCLTEIPKKAKICPNCKKKQGGGCLPKIGTVLLILIALSIFGGGEDSTDTSNVATETTDKNQNLNDNQEPNDVAEIKESLIYDENNVKIFVKSLDDKGSYYNLNLYIENNSDLNLGFNAHSYAVNKINTGNNIYDMDCDVASNKKANVSLEIYKEYWDFLNTSELKVLDVLFWAYDNDAYFKEFDTGQITINTSLDDGSYEFCVGEKIYENNDITIEYLFNKNNKYYYQFSNLSSEYLEFHVNNLTINDYTSSETDFDLIGLSALSGCKAIFAIEPSSEFLNLNEIENINKIEFTLNIIPMEDYYREWNTEMITFELNK